MKTDLQITKHSDSIVVIPAYEPSEVLIDLIHTLTDSGYAVLVVNDGSNEKYYTGVNQALSKTVAKNSSLNFQLR